MRWHLWRTRHLPGREGTQSLWYTTLYNLYAILHLLFHYILRIRAPAPALAPTPPSPTISTTTTGVKIITLLIKEETEVWRKFGESKLVRSWSILARYWQAYEGHRLIEPEIVKESPRQKYWESETNAESYLRAFACVMPTASHALFFPFFFFFFAKLMLPCLLRLTFA